MSEELEALKRIEDKTIKITYGKEVVYYRYGDYLPKEDLDIIKKSFKALEIIKKYYEVNYEGTDLQIIPQNLTDLKQYYADMELLKELML